MTIYIKNKVLVGGCFDILHYGHVMFLKKAKSFGDYLIVAMESDKNIKRLKGCARPIQNQKQRKEILESLKFVDQVIILKDKMFEKDYFDLVKKVKPAVIAATKDDPVLKNKRKQAKMVGAKLIIIPKTKSSSTTKILET